MRKIGHIAETAQAKLFSDYLYAEGIENEIEGEDANGWDLWVYNEEQLAAAAQELKVFELDPAAAKYAAAVQVAEERHRKEKATAAAFQKNMFDRKRVLSRSVILVAPVTFILIAVSVVVTLLGGLGSGSQLTQWLSIAPYGEGLSQLGGKLAEVRSGQLWRLVTPIFIHASLTGSMGLFHILFNMLWLKELGVMLERSQGRRGMITKVLVLAILSNFGQYAAAGPAFGGMSGVVYGLLGYCWMRGRFDLTSGLFVHNQTVIMMTVWFFMCLFGAMGPIANAAHGVGLVAGIAWGYASSYLVNMRRA